MMFATGGTIGTTSLIKTATVVTVRITVTQIYKGKAHCVSCGGKYSTDWQFHIYDCDNDNACLLPKDYEKDWLLSIEKAEKKLMELNGNGRN